MKNFDFKNETGRSMIEMLGVLAIIGVLSVGGIAGYSKAMHRYRINKTIEQITLIAGNVRSFFAPQRSYEGLGPCSNDNDYCKLIKKAKLMPDEMWDDTAKRFNNVFGGSVHLHTANKSKSGDKQAFSIDYDYGLPLDYDVCIELLGHDWSAAGVTGIDVGTYGPPVSGGIRTVPCSAAINTASQYQGMGNIISFYFDVNSNCWNETNKYAPNTCS